MTLQMSDGSTTTIKDLCKDGPLALVFIRHLGCIFCRETVAQLAEKAPCERIVLVGMADPTLATEFLTQIESPHPMICDPERELYNEMGVTRGSVAQVIGPKVWRRGFAAYRAGFRNSKPIGDPWQLPGAFVLDSEAKIVWSHVAKDASDTPSPDELVQVLRSLSL